MTDSQQLVAEYVRNGSDATFRELVSRYVDLVYSTALRLVEGDTHRAEDITQTVFVDLARKARTLPADVRLGGWLHRDTCQVAGHTLRGERRRQSRERQAAEMNALQNHSAADFSQVAPLLDEAINELGEADRTAILLRFFEQQDFRTVGQALGSNEDAARMSVTRALEKLEEFLKRRGVTTTAASLGVVLTANAVQAAPVGLAVTISTAVALAGTTITTTTAVVMTTLQKTIIGATIAATVGVGIFEARQASDARAEVQALKQQQAPLAGQNQQLQHDRDRAVEQLAALREENDRLNRNTADLLKLRAEVTRLKANPTANDPEEATVRKWTSRLNALKKYATETPGCLIPESQFCDEYDWFIAIQMTQDRELKTDVDMKNAMMNVTERAKVQFSYIMTDALRKYLEANGSQLPSQLSDLRPFFRVPVGDNVLERYELLRTGNVKDLSEYDRKCGIVSEKKSVANEGNLGMMQIGAASYRNLSSY